MTWRRQLALLVLSLLGCLWAFEIVTSSNPFALQALAVLLGLVSLMFLCTSSEVVLDLFLEERRGKSAGEQDGN